MINQKEIFIPKINGVEMSNVDATANFTTDAFEFPNSGKDWSVDFQVSKTLAVPADSFAITTAGSGLTNGAYNNFELVGGALVNLTVAGGIVTVIAFVSGGSGYINGGVYAPLDPIPGLITAVQPTFTATVTTNTDSTASITVCNTQDGVFKEYKTAATAMPLATVTGVFDEFMPYRYMKIAYTANTSTGLINLSVCR
jgi:hypothetical protein